MPQRNAVIDLLRKAGVECYTRKEWGSKQLAAYIKRRSTHPMPPAPAKYHFLHITVTNDTDTVLTGKAGARQIETFGLSSPPQVSYQDLVTNEGRYFQGQDYGNKGTHTVNDKRVPPFSRDLNQEGYALALMQNVNDAVTDKQVRVVAMVFAARELTGWVRKGAPVYPHRKFAWKGCPGDKAMARLAEIERLKNDFVKKGTIMPTQPTETRGKALDEALKNLRLAKKNAKSAARIAKIQRAIKAILEIKPK